MAYDMTEVMDAYDILTAQVKTDLDEQFTKNRIKGTEYADAYKDLMNTCLQLSMDVPLKGSQIEIALADLALKEKQLEVMEQDLLIKEQDLLIKEQELLIKQQELILMDKQIDKIDQDILVSIAQEALTVRQTEGFDDNLRQKMLEIQMNTWAMMFSSGLLTETPDIITSDEVSDLYCFMKEQVLDATCNPVTS